MTPTPALLRLIDTEAPIEIKNLSIPEVWIAPPPVQELRELVRYHKLGCLRTGLKAVLAKHGLQPPVNDLWSLAGTAYLKGLDIDGMFTREGRRPRSTVKHPSAAAPLNVG